MLNNATLSALKQSLVRLLYVVFEVPGLGSAFFESSFTPARRFGLRTHKVAARKLEHHSPPALKVKYRGSQH